MFALDRENNIYQHLLNYLYNLQNKFLRYINKNKCLPIIGYRGYEYNL